MRAATVMEAMAGCLAAGLAIGCGAASRGAPEAVTDEPLTVDDTPPVERLDDRARPVEYSLDLDVDPQRSSFTGVVRIELELERPARVVWLNARGLTIDRAILRWGEGRHAAATVLPDPGPEAREQRTRLLGLSVPDPIPRGRASVEIAYRGELGQEVGLVRAGDPDPVVFADLEPNDAEAAFPCFDDPRFKAPFRVSLVVPEWATALSNAEEAGVDALGDGRRRVRFEPTRPMSSYLVAILVGRLEIVDGPTSPIPIRAVVAPGQAARARHALSRTPVVLEALARALDEPVPYPKLDIAAIPSTSGRTRGMESPGLLTISERVLLVEEEGEGAALEQRRAELDTVLTHELAHLWIGDLVTLASWGDLWINEGFAMWLGRAISAQLDPAAAARRASDLSTVDLIAEELTRPREAVRRPSLPPGDADQMFCLTTYAGGAAVLSTLEAWLGQERLLGVVRALVHARRDGTVAIDDVVGAVAAAARAAGTDADVEAMMLGLLDRPRTPRVTVSPACGSDGAVVEIDVETRSSPAFPLPVCILWDGATEPACQVVLGHGSIHLDGCPRWVHPNPGSTALYTWRLPRGWVSPLVEQAPLGADDARAIRTWVVPEVEETDLPGEVSALALLSALGDPYALQRLEAIERATIEPATRRGFLEHVRRAVGDRPVGFDRALSTPPVIAFAGWLAQLGDAALRDEASRAVEESLAGRGPGTIAVDFPAFAAAASGGGDALFRELSRDAMDRRSKTRAASLHGIGSFQDDAALGRLEKVLRRPQLSGLDVSMLLDAAAANPAMRDDLVVLAQGADPSRLSSSTLASLAAALCDDESFADLGGAFARLELSEEAIQRARESVAECALLRSSRVEEARAAWTAR